MSPRRIEEKTHYIPYMCDHCYTLAAAIRAQGTPAEVLPPPDRESLEIGLGLCKGRECLPCFLSTGDFILAARRKGFDPASSVLFMPTTAGPCRFGQYHVLQRQILEREGITGVEILAPTGASSFQWPGRNSRRTRTLIWTATVAVDMLQKLLYETRPYERRPGSADSLYSAHLNRLVSAIESGGGRGVDVALEEAAAGFSLIPVDRAKPRPIVGIVGEIYLRHNAYGNNDLARKVEEAGGEVLLAGVAEFFQMSHWLYLRHMAERRRPRAWVGAWITQWVQDRIERRLHHRIAPALRQPEETSVRRLLHRLSPLYPPRLGTEAVLSLSKPADLMDMGASGILNVLPFSCMPGIITQAMAPALRRSLGGIPWLDVVYDAQEQTNVNTRMEAFMHQVAHFQRTRSSAAIPPEIGPRAVPADPMPQSFHGSS